MRNRRTITLAISLVLLLVVATGYFAYANNLIPFLRTSAGTNTTQHSITVTRLIALSHYLVSDPPFGQGFTTNGDYVQVSGMNGLKAVRDFRKLKHPRSDGEK